MVKLIALYKKPADPSSFDRHYQETHLPMVKRWPGLRKVELGRVTGMMGGGDPPYYLITEMYFDTGDVMRAALRSPEARSTGEELQRFAPGLVTLLYAQVEPEPAS